MHPGQPLTYTMLLRNGTGVGPLNARFTNTLPNYTAGAAPLATSSGRTGRAGRALTWTGAVTPGVPVTVTLRVTVAAGVREGRVINNRVVLDDGTGGRLAVASGLTPVRWYRVWLPLVKGRGASFAVGDDAPR